MVSHQFLIIFTSQKVGRNRFVFILYPYFKRFRLNSWIFKLYFKKDGIRQSAVIIGIYLQKVVSSIFAMEWKGEVTLFLLRNFPHHIFPFENLVEKFSLSPTLISKKLPSPFPLLPSIKPNFQMVEKKPIMSWSKTKTSLFIPLPLLSEWHAAAHQKRKEMMKSHQIALKLPTTILNSILFLSLNSLTILVVFAESGVGIGTAYDALLISIAFAFCAALSALLVPQRHTLATFCAFYSLASMASALLLLIWALYHTLTCATPTPH